MTEYHDKPRKRPRRVSEAAPVQVFLNRTDRDLLDTLTGRLGLSKSDVVRRSLLALDRQVSDASAHPALKLIGLVDDDGLDGSVDPAREHDRILASTHESPRGTARKRRGKS